MASLSLEELQAENENLREKLAEAERARDEVTAERDVLRAAFMQMPALCSIMEGPEHTFLLANDRLRSLIGGRDPVGRPVRDAMPEIIEAGYGDRLQRVLTTGEPLVGESFPADIIDPAIASGWLSYQYVPLRRKDGEIFGVMFHAMDVTEQRKLERQQQILHEELVAAQQQSIRDLSTPLIPLADELVVMPLVGSIDPGRAGQILETLLTGITTHQAAVAILDITGVRGMDESVAGALIKTAAAARLLGTEMILTGISPEVARTLVEIGADLGAITTHGTLQSGVTYAMTRVGGSSRQRTETARRIIT
ncbi:STAS domain-containing protein [Chondromyces crocatus]|uniref:STAS domain-containing protein n=1 Tax=Chondromyces crocatus TaxID=52 RepID=A0A0K1E967_CHOCO|nr:STAS domain-containing protein [Chondromyces crocatus]AKT37108.1 uncharacterized protein CMC5_012360 [Chondromyces crocatus]